jgi:hypothetical protein
MQVEFSRQPYVFSLFFFEKSVNNGGFIPRIMVLSWHLKKGGIKHGHKIAAGTLCIRAAEL